MLKLNEVPQDIDQEDPNLLVHVRNLIDQLDQEVSPSGKKFVRDIGIIFFVLDGLRAQSIAFSAIMSGEHDQKIKACLRKRLKCIVPFR